MLKAVFRSGLLAMLVACAGVQAQTIAVVPSIQAVNVGDAVTVDLQISGLGNGTAPSLGIFDIDFGFDPSLLVFSSVLYGSGLDVLDLGSWQATTPGVGTVNLFELSFDSADDLNALQADSFALATLSFNALASGSSPFTLSLNAVGDAYGADLPVTWSGGSVTIAAPVATSVPEPETLALTLISLGALGFSMPRRKRRVT